MRWAPLKIKATMQTKANLDKIALYLGLPVFFNVARWNKIRGVLVLFITYSHVAFPNCKLFYLCSQILRFLRIDRKATAKGDTSPKPCVITVQEFQKRIENFPLNTVNPQWFLNETSERNNIPSSRHLLHIHGKQKKCYQIYHSSLEESVIEQLEAG